MSDAKKALEARSRFIAGVVKKDVDRKGGDDDDMLSSGSDSQTTELSDIYKSSTEVSESAFNVRETREHVSDSHLMYV